MNLQIKGSNLIGSERSAYGSSRYSAVSPPTGAVLPEQFADATNPEIDRACTLAAEAFEEMQSLSGEAIAAFLSQIADRLSEARHALIERCVAETDLPVARLDGEINRTTFQLRMFADVTRTGSASDIRVDRADANRKPLPKPDVRRWLVGIGPVAVFGAANFPFAFSVAGGDTASAFAARCPVVTKAHPAHPGTSELVGQIIAESVVSSKLPPGTFSLLHGHLPAVSLELVRHPKMKAVGFTGSLRAGQALIAAANARAEPIPVFAEMGSINPVFLLPGAVRSRGIDIADGLMNAITLGNGQFCTSPGLIAGMESPEFDALVDHMISRARSTPPATMLHGGIINGFRDGVDRWRQVAGLKLATDSQQASNGVCPQIATISAQDFLARSTLQEEVFGPAAIVVKCESPAQQLQVARDLEGSLTATVHGDDSDINVARQLVAVLQRLAGRLIWNGYPTGVEVCHAMQHGGPFPASNDSRFTSVGTAAILRWLRPVAFQNFPDGLLPNELKNQATGG